MLIVALHDVAPSTLGEVRWLLERLDAAGVRRRVVKVIPADPGATPAQLQELEELVRTEVAAGSEVVQHGWSHHAAGPLRGGVIDRVRARLFAGDAAEFLTLDAPEMERRLREGRDRLARWGASIDGFCAPGWLATADLEPAAAAAGLRYLVTLRGLRDLSRRRWVTLPPVGYMGTGGVQEALVGIGGLVISRPLVRAVGAGAHRVFLHPQGAPRSPACERVLERIAALARGERVGTYRELLDD